ncbi:hypothetical protein BGZ65_011135, partial [Modicella reniformis]
MSFPMLGVAFRMRGTVSTRGRIVARLKHDPTPRLRLANRPAWWGPQAVSYRFISHFGTSNDSTAIQDQASPSAQIIMDIRNGSYHKNVISYATSGNVEATATTISTITTPATTTTMTTTTTTTQNTTNSVSNSSYRTKHHKTQFTPEVDAEILRLRKQGYSWTTVGSLLGLSHRSCHRRYITALDPNLEFWPEEKVHRLENLVVQRKSWTEIAAVLGGTATNCQ